MNTSGDNVKDDNMTDRDTADPAVRTVIVEDGVDSDLDVEVKVLTHQVTDDPDDRLVHLRYAHGPHRHTAGDRIALPVSMLRRIINEVDPPGDGPIVTDAGDRLSLTWPDPRPRYVTATPEFIDDVVDQINRLRTVLNDVRRHLPDSYAAVEGGTVEWVADLRELHRQVAPLFADDGEFVQGMDVDTSTGAVPVATATLDMAIVERFRALVSKIDGGDL